MLLVSETGSAYILLNDWVHRDLPLAKSGRLNLVSEFPRRDGNKFASIPVVGHAGGKQGLSEAVLPQLTSLREDQLSNDRVIIPGCSRGPTIAFSTRLLCLSSRLCWSRGLH